MQAKQITLDVFSDINRFSGLYENDAIGVDIILEMLESSVYDVKCDKNGSPLQDVAQAKRLIKEGGIDDRITCHWESLSELFGEKMVSSNITFKNSDDGTFVAWNLDLDQTFHEATPTFSGAKYGLLWNERDIIEEDDPFKRGYRTEIVNPKIIVNGKTQSFNLNTIHDLKHVL